MSSISVSSESSLSSSNEDGVEGTTRVCSSNSTCLAFPFPLLDDEGVAASLESLRDRSRVAGGDGNMVDAIEVVGDDLLELALLNARLGMTSVN